MIIGIDASRAFSNFWGGPESYSYHLIRAMLKTPCSHTFRLYVGPQASKSPRFRPFFSNLSNVKGQMLKVSYQLSIVPWPRLWTQGGLALECLVNPSDVLFVPAHTLPILRRPSLKTVVTIHDLGAEFLPNYHKFPQKYYLNLMTEYALKQATKIIAVSEFTKKTIINKFHDKNRHPELHDVKDLDPSGRAPQDDREVGEKIKVIYEGYDRRTFYPRLPQEIESIKKKLGIEDNYFLFVGTIQPRKNLVRLIEAFSRICQLSIVNPPTGEAGCQLLLVGSPGWINEEIYKAPNKFGVEDRVKFLGHVEEDELAGLMSGCQAFVFPSLYEGFGLAPLEAMACGAPVIMSNVTSLPEVGGQAALYVDPLSVPDIVQKMSLVASFEREKRQEWVMRSSEQAQKFSWEKAALETLEVLEASHV